MVSFTYHISPMETVWCWDITVTSCSTLFGHFQNALLTWSSSSACLRNERHRHNRNEAFLNVTAKDWMNYCKPIAARAAECTCHSQEQMSRRVNHCPMAMRRLFSLVDQNVYVCCLNEMNSEHQNSYVCGIKTTCDEPTCSGNCTVPKHVTPANDTVHQG